MPSKFLDTPPAPIVPYYQKETPEKGGAAVIRMILECSKVGAAALPPQSQLYTEAKSANLGTEPAGIWDIDPEGMRTVLMNHRPPTFQNSFVVSEFGAGQINQANNLIIHTIDHYEVPPAVLTDGGENWVAVTGYQTDSSSLQFFQVHDPAPALSDPGDPNYIPGTGLPNEVIVASAWNDLRFRRVIGGSRWLDKYVMVRDPVPEAEPIGIFRQRPRWKDGLIPPDRVADIVREVMDELGLFKLPGYSDAFDRAGDPLLVQNRARRSYYYLLRYHTGEHDSAVVAIDARTGVFLSSSILPGKTTLVRVTPDEIVKWLTRGYAAYREPGADLDLILQLLHSRCCEHPMQRDSATHPWAFTSIRDQLWNLRKPVEYVQPLPEEIHVSRTLVWDTVGGARSILLPYYEVFVGRERLYIGIHDAKFLWWWFWMFRRYGS